MNAGAKKKSRKKSEKPKPAFPRTDKTAPSLRDDTSEGPDRDSYQEVKTPASAAACQDQPGVLAGSPAPNGHVSSNKDRISSSSPIIESEGTNAAAAFSAMTVETEALKARVEELRKQLESMQTSHDAELHKLKDELEESETGREEAETQYETLQERVSQIKSNVAERLQRDKEQLEEAKSRIQKLESSNEQLEQEKKTVTQEAASLREDLDDAERELSSLRSRSNLSQSNWQRERDDLVRLHVQLKEELTSATGAMGEWEVIAMEERARRESLGDKVTELEEQASTLREVLEKTTNERDTHAMAVESLQRALQEIQDARKLELREMVESSEKQMAAMRRAVVETEAKAATAASEREKLIAEVERMTPFEKEIKEKNLLIGKLRHEAIVLNDHLTRALKYLKKIQPESQVDRQIISNYFIQFLSLDRGDQKRFQILQIISGYLNWTDDEKAKVGLMKGGGGGTSVSGMPSGPSSGTSLRMAQSSFHRTPSTPSLNTEFFTQDTPSATKESLADLWAGFLERGAEEAVGEGIRKDGVSNIGGGAPEKK